MITLAALSLSGLVPLIIWLVVAGLIFWLLTWLVNYVALPEPFAKIARVLIAVVAVIMVINALLSLTGNGFITY